MTLMHPILNNNGTSRAELVKQRRAALEALLVAMEALSETRPNGRDYIGHEDAYQADRATYQDRFAMLDKLHNELKDEALAIHRA